MDETERVVLEVLEDCGGGSATVGEIAHKTSMNEESVEVVVSRLVAKGMVRTIDDYTMFGKVVVLHGDNGQLPFGFMMGLLLVVAGLIVLVKVI